MSCSPTEKRTTTDGVSDQPSKLSWCETAGKENIARAVSVTSSRGAMGQPTRMAAVAILLPFLWAATLGQDSNECVANASAQTDPNNATGEAISNAVAQAFTKTIVCENGVQPNNQDTAALAISVAVAVSESRSSGAECFADANAAAEEVSNRVADKIADGLVSGAPGESQQYLAGVWLEREKPTIKDKVKQGETSYNGAARDYRGCVDLSSIIGSTPTAAEVGALLDSAISQILEAVACGTNVEKSEGECSYDGKVFMGRCIEGEVAAEMAEKKVTAQLRQEEAGGN